MDKFSLLLVDDNPTFYRIIDQFFQAHQQFGRMEWARNGREAIDMAGQLNPDLVLLDLGMPDISGLEILPVMRSILPRAGIFVVTLLDTDTYRRAALQAGADGFIPKARLNAELMTAIEDFTDSQGNMAQAF